jgi:2,3-bisphosphoglycerate-independent phosphoglycerate mutase
MGIPIDDNAVAFRCNLVTVQGDLLADYSAGAISSEEGRELVTLLNEQLVSLALGCVAFYPGVSYRHLLVASNGFGDDLQCWPPHDVIGQSFGPYLPKGQGAELLCQLMEASRSLLADHPVNRRRVEQGRNPANMIWLWGQGRLPRLVSFPQRRGVGGAVITAVDVIRGLGRLAGLGVMRVPGVTGELNTNYEGKVAAALGVLEEHDFVCVHVEAPDEAAHHGSLEDKIAAVESFDRRVVKPMLEGLQARYTAFKVLMLTDHYTPLSLRTHSPEPVPFAIYTAGGKGGLADSFDEASAQEDSLVFTKGYRLMDFFISD